MDSTVRQLRLVVEADDYDAAVAFYRDVLGLVEEESYQDGDAQVAILGAGRATLEIINSAQKAMIDDIEVGRPVAPHMRVAFEVADSAATTDAARRGRCNGRGGPHCHAVAVTQRAARRSGRPASHGVPGARASRRLSPLPPRGQLRSGCRDQAHAQAANPQREERCADVDQHDQPVRFGRPALQDTEEEAG